MSLADRLEQVRSREDLFDFIVALTEECENGEKPWNNRTLLEYLDGMSGWINGADGAYRNIKGEERVPDPPTWEFIAWMLLAATDYE